jgi:ribosomal-protein-alanine N-acetyltransferase
MLQFNFEPFPHLQSERLLLRKIGAADADELFKFRSDAREMKYIDRPPARSLDETLEWIGSITGMLQRQEAITWGITLNDGKDLIGTIGFWRINAEHHRAELGYMLSAEHHRMGYMQDAFVEVLSYGFVIMKLHSIEANVNPENHASIKILERNGFVREAYFKENYFYDGKFLDSAIYSLLTPLKKVQIP